MTSAQLKVIHVAKRQLGLDDDDYRAILREKGGAESSKDLTPRGLEDVMAHFEHRGFRQAGAAADYWRQKQFRRGLFADSRQLHLIQQLAAQSRYGLPALCLRFSRERTDQPAELTAKEASNLIDMLKASNAREREKVA